MMPNRLRACAVSLALLLAGAFCSAPPASAVIGGSVSGYGPWAVRMLVDGKPLCTGTAVAPDWVLSASHCFFEQGSAVDDTRITFRVGSLDERTGRTVRPVEGSRNGNADADMMLIKVSRMGVIPARLPGPATVHPGQAVRQYGWGATCRDDEDACQSDLLRQSELRVLDAGDKRCAGFAVPGGTDFCAAGVSGVPAGGDSGGPVMAVGKGGPDTLVGVLSGSDRSHITGSGEVSQQLGWIRHTIRH